METFWILHNVVQNAIKYTDSGNISIGFEKFDRIIKNKKGYYIDHITKQPHYAEPNSELRQVGLSFTVKDSGIGIPSESHGTALTGTRGANAVKSGKPGNGQGLRTVNDILKSIDGDIQIQSPVNGKTFSDPNPGTEIACFIPFYELRT